jgi:hypothetical protein
MHFFGLANILIRTQIRYTAPWSGLYKDSSSCAVFAHLLVHIHSSAHVHCSFLETVMKFLPLAVLSLINLVGAQSVSLFVYDMNSVTQL